MTLGWLVVDGDDFWSGEKQMVRKSDTLLKRDRKDLFLNSSRAKEVRSLVDDDHLRLASIVILKSPYQIVVI